MEDHSAQLNQERAQNQNLKQRAKKAVKERILDETEVSDAEFILMGLVALIADFAVTFGFLAVPILWFWYFIRFKKFPTNKFLTAGGLELVSLGFLPAWTGLIVFSYLEQKGYLGNGLLTKLAKK